MSHWEPYIEHRNDETAAIDLISFVKDQLLESDVLEQNIEISPIDTASDLNYFSHYRSQRTGEPEGRFATVFGMRG